MKIKTLTNLSGHTFTFSRNAEYNVEPGLAHSLIASGHAVAVGDNEEVLFPPAFPFKEKLYHRGFANPESVLENLDKISTTKGLGPHVVKEIKAFASADAPAPTPTLPKEMPHAATLIENGIINIADYMATTAAQLAFLSPEEIAEINAYLTPEPEEEKKSNPAEVKTAVNPAVAKAENAAKKTNAKSNGKK